MPTTTKKLSWTQTEPEDASRYARVSDNFETYYAELPASMSIDAVCDTFAETYDHKRPRELLLCHHRQRRGGRLQAVRDLVTPPNWSQHGE